MPERRNLRSRAVEAASSVAGTLGEGARGVARTARQGASQAREDLQSAVESQRQVTDQEQARIQRARQEAEQEARRQAQEEFREEFRDELEEELRDQELQRLRREYGLADDDMEEPERREPRMPGMLPEPGAEPQRAAPERRDTTEPERRQPGGIPLGPPPGSGVELRFMGGDDDDRGGFF